MEIYLDLCAITFFFCLSFRYSLDVAIDRRLDEERKTMAGQEEANE